MYTNVTNLISHTVNTCQLKKRKYLNMLGTLPFGVFIYYLYFFENLFFIRINLIVNMQIVCFRFQFDA